MTREEFRKKYREPVIAYTCWQVFAIGWYNIDRIIKEMKAEEQMPGVYDCIIDYHDLPVSDQRWIMKKYL